MATWRERLCDLSWLMRCLNEYLARRANAEDGCRGRFWEGRFKYQALLDEAGLLTCMAYVDLNPIRAGMAKTFHASKFTSIYKRIQHVAAACTENKRGRNGAVLAPIPLASLGRANALERPELAFSLNDYVALLDWTGRAIREDKRGHIPNDLPPILVRLQINPRVWLKHMRPRGNRFGRAIGRVEALRAYAMECGQRSVRGVSANSSLFGNVN